MCSVRQINALMLQRCNVPLRLISTYQHIHTSFSAPIHVLRVKQILLQLLCHRRRRLLLQQPHTPRLVFTFNKTRLLENRPESLFSQPEPGQRWGHTSNSSGRNYQIKDLVDLWLHGSEGPGLSIQYPPKCSSKLPGFLSGPGPAAAWRRVRYSP